jgi:hypothetical protein
MFKNCGAHTIDLFDQRVSGEFASEGRVPDSRRMAGNRTAEVKRILETGRLTGRRKRIEKAEEEDRVSG